MAGEVDQIKGRAKQAAGDLTDDEQLKAEGQADETGGKVKEAANDVIDRAKDGIDKLKKAVN